ncbi:hypothetical protein ABZ454_37275 [Streptomyces sp. NPDC005803]|uniref:hypothetical protein n=1 Tax=Streptomyces sp. NPDC005803 TaxID=3154297 RepID=UPI00340D2EBE
MLALTGKEVAHELNIEPHQPGYGALGPPTLPRCRTPPRALSLHATDAASAGQFTEVGWGQGSKGAMTSRFAVLVVRPAGKQSLAAAQAAGGGRSQWDGVLPASTVLVEWPAGNEAPTDYWISNLPPDTPVADLLRWAKMRRCSNTTTANSSTARAWTTSRVPHLARLAPLRHPRHRRQAFLTLRRLDPKVHTSA